ncbi:uncharacterized protein FOMMEDRAFT_150408 [Fomitiporia mediterranea MF3/22]|uniref:uncharacterized protein n=1 Tax=Fomitiporia mediterranea (strain MF3/22) TaxID=694068 RepID=UPI0004409C20|nr:uncharacterized protein FOMMEDRAFT_150408 [Fomitiporia mediterranea MF3/22]EJD07829.1 hypothetical protein FOMMEDRAFT_150408 [Fomitiporia mediterranea MF3/22]
MTDIQMLGFVIPRRLEINSHAGKDDTSFSGARIALIDGGKSPIPARVAKAGYQPNFTVYGSTCGLTQAISMIHRASPPDAAEAHLRVIYIWPSHSPLYQSEFTELEYVILNAAEFAHSDPLVSKSWFLTANPTSSGQSRMSNTSIIRFIANLREGRDNRQSSHVSRGDAIRKIKLDGLRGSRGDCSASHAI